MGKIAIVTDSNSGITQDEGRALGISVLPMPFYINEVMYLEGITLSQEEFYEKLKNDENISTSQPSPADVCGLWDMLLEKNDEIVHIPMSSGLSNSCETAMALARDYDGKVQVVDNQRISVTQKQSVLDAMELVRAGFNAAQIKERLIRSIFMLSDLVSFFLRNPPKRSEETADAAARSCESAVDMVEARIPARMVPARNAGRIPCVLRRSAILTMIVSEAEPSSKVSSPAFVIPRPTTPMRTATAREITTHVVATLLERESFFSSSIAMKRRRM